ncbi:unnamed protein product [Vitrella brassicaformis CCMP3155]|uniref:Uncharacterized protein n=2 Tax=Vitrella brassicaformis TaxID=1169539 RepID=A0A0G4FLN1_VITBC|nr:unnamed protein product [Vitrella brassicaformis CCMP3155]|eukprot:CEM14381.1 unnamed protein product [Vitrella brassicaformis CCMP3155]
MAKLFIEVTPPIRAFLRKSSSASRQCLAHSPNTPATVELDHLIQLVEEHNAPLPARHHVKLHELMDGAGVVRRSTEGDGEENLSEMDRLRRRREEAAYQRSIHKVTASGSAGGGGGGVLGGETVQQYRGSLALAGNFILCLVGSFLAGYYLCVYLEVESITTRALVSACFAFVCLLMEVVLFIIFEEKQRAWELKRQKDKERAAQRRSKKAAGGGGQMNGPVSSMGEATEVAAVGAAELRRRGGGGEEGGEE